MTTRHRLLALGLATLTGVLCAVTLVSPTAANADSGDGSFTATKTITRTHLNPDGTESVADSKTVTLKVSQTQSLRGRQDVTVSWTGAHPSGAIQPDPNSLLAPTEEYPMVLLECRGVDNGTTGPGAVSPETCWTHGSQARFGQSRNSAFGAWRVDRYASAAQRVAVVGRPNPEPAACIPVNANAEFWVPFIGVDGTVYNYGNNGCGGIAPEDYQVDSGTTNVPQNSTFAPTGVDGTGAVKFDVWTEAENSSLGCSATVACTLEAIPVMGISCDPAGLSPASPGLPAADVPTSGDELTQAASDCESTGAYAPGSAAQGGSTYPAVNGTLWWSASNWRNRIAVPLEFAPVSNACDIIGSGSVTQVYGSELLSEATSQWAPAFCTDPKLFRFTHVQTSEPLARTTLQNGSISAAFSSGAPDGGFTAPTVQAPVAASGFSISYNVDDSTGHPVTNLRMTPRLLAKLLTESYTAVAAVHSSYTALAANPVNITKDPEFVALNPGIARSGGDPGPATLYALSGDSDVTKALTSYIAADPEAEAWLNGAADPWGMVVNPAYLKIALPVAHWPLLDTFIPDLGADNDCEQQDPTPFLPAVASPTPSLATTTIAVQFAGLVSKIGCNSLAAGSSTIGQWVPFGRQVPGQRFVLGVTSLGEASRYSLNSAALQTHSTVTAYSAKYTSDAGRTFVTASQSSMLAATKLFTPNSSTGVWTIPYDTLRTSAAGATAYPGTMIVYADVPTTGLAADQATNLSKLLTFAAGPGQVAGFGNGQLPPGYLPVTAANGLKAMLDYTIAAAADVLAQNGQVPGSAIEATTVTAPAATVQPNTASTYRPPTISTNSAATSAAPSSASSAAPTPLTSSEVKAIERGRTAAATSSLGSSVLPVILGLGLLGALLSASGRVRPTRFGRRR